MQGADDAYSRLINWLKILLPLAALAILSTLFLLSRSIDPTQAIPYADVDVDELTRAPQINTPDFSGVTGDGTAVTLKATVAKPDPANPGRITATAPLAVVETPDGVRADISAASGTIDSAAGVLTLAGRALFVTSLGYRIETERIDIALDSTRVESGGAITATGPFGDLSAGQMVLEQSRETPKSYVLVFKGGVKLVYDPKD